MVLKGLKILISLILAVSNSVKLLSLLMRKKSGVSRPDPIPRADYFNMSDHGFRIQGYAGGFSAGYSFSTILSTPFLSSSKFGIYSLSFFTTSYSFYSSTFNAATSSVNFLMMASF